MLVRLLPLAVILAAPAAAQPGPGAAPPAAAPLRGPPAAACPPPPGFAAWTKPMPMVAADHLATAPLPELDLGRAAVLALAPSEKLRYAAKPGKAGGAPSYGGLIAFTAPRAGRYRIALGAPAWLDVVRRGRVLRSTAHAHGPACGTVRKLVDFTLAPGRYTLQLAAAPAPTLTLMVVRQP
ncbi:homogentisate 1,2-dioxygenase [Sphingomonas morindae]|uniref:Homogentisate 1,2-dioxygenase n=1 Tax=Sphingomonas morindae TaxID=1541170 RepID=A0ABY4XBB3_9SPHN|nr:homogentisate 1,2-dioxygenase [Sphingomonas morindae]USI73985.1 homogentisate 1,2-dioxygenase [Sphingomonas morindae]